MIDLEMIKNKFNKWNINWLIILSFIILVFTECESESQKRHENQITGNSKKQTLTKKTKKNIYFDTINIGIIPLGEVDSDLILLLKNEIQTFYQHKTVLLGSKPLPSSAFYEPRKRYKADQLLDFLETIRPKDVDYLIGITEADISVKYPPYEDWGIFGLGSLPGNTCIISSFRVKPSAKNRRHFEERITKIALHEIGHNFGLDHCSNKLCLMEDAKGTIKSVDCESKALCKICRSNKLASCAPILVEPNQL